MGVAAVRTEYAEIVCCYKFDTCLPMDIGRGRISS
jgi:hypothetical protein